MSGILHGALMSAGCFTKVTVAVQLDEDRVKVMRKKMQIMQ